MCFFKGSPSGLAVQVMVDLRESIGGPTRKIEHPRLVEATCGLDRQTGNLKLVARRRFTNDALVKQLKNAGNSPYTCSG